MATRLAKSVQMGGYLAVTAAARGAGMVREILLLSAIGIGRDLDAFVFILVVPSVVTLLVSSVIYTNVTPQAASMFDANNGHTQAERVLSIERLLSQALRLGFALTAVAAVANLALVSLAGPGNSSNTGGDLVVAAVVSTTVLFTVVAEYFAALLTAQRQVGFLVAGNLFISLPAIVALALFDLTIGAYAVVFALSFALRALYLIIALRRTFAFRLIPVDSIRATKMPRWSRSAFSAASALIAVQLATQFATLIARFLPTGSLSLFYYGLRLPMLYLSTVWFVIGTDFFGAIQRGVRPDLKRRIRSVSGLNTISLCFAYLGAVLFLLVIEPLFPDAWADLRLDDIVRLSLYCLPIVAVIPMIDMAQKTFATLDVSRRTIRIARTVLLASTVLSSAALVFDQVEALLVGLTLGLGVGALVAARQLGDELDPNADTAAASSNRAVS